MTSLQRITQGPALGPGCPSMSPSTAHPQLSQWGDAQGPSVGTRCLHSPQKRGCSRLGSPKNLGGKTPALGLPLVWSRSIARHRPGLQGRAGAASTGWARKRGVSIPMPLKPLITKESGTQGQALHPAQAPLWAPPRDRSPCRHVGFPAAHCGSLTPSLPRGLPPHSQTPSSCTRECRDSVQGLQQCQALWRHSGDPRGGAGAATLLCTPHRDRSCLYTGSASLTLLELDLWPQCNPVSRPSIRGVLGNGQLPLTDL